MWRENAPRNTKTVITSRFVSRSRFVLQQGRRDFRVRLQRTRSGHQPACRVSVDAALSIGAGGTGPVPGYVFGRQGTAKQSPAANSIFSVAEGADHTAERGTPVFVNLLQLLLSPGEPHAPAAPRKDQTSTDQFKFPADTNPHTGAGSGHEQKATVPSFGFRSPGTLEPPQIADALIRFMVQSGGSANGGTVPSPARRATLLNDAEGQTTSVPRKNGIATDKKTRKRNDFEIASATTPYLVSASMQVTALGISTAAAVVPSEHAPGPQAQTGAPAPDPGGARSSSDRGNSAANGGTERMLLQDAPTPPALNAGLAFAALLIPKDVAPKNFAPNQTASNEVEPARVPAQRQVAASFRAPSDSPLSRASAEEEPSGLQPVIGAMLQDHQSDQPSTWHRQLDPVPHAHVPDDRQSPAAANPGPAQAIADSAQAGTVHSFPANESASPSSGPPKDVSDPAQSQPPSTNHNSLQKDGLTLRVAPPDAVPVDVHVRQRSGEVHVAVRTADPNLQISLRRELPDLVNSLDRAGFQAETFAPESSTRWLAHEVSPQSGSDTGDSRGREQPQPQNPGRHQPGQHHPGDSRHKDRLMETWMDQLEG